MSEEERAALYRQQQRNRVRFKRVMNRRLKGNPALAKAVREAWKPITDRIRGC